MKVETILFGVIEIPDTKELVETELHRCKERFYISQTRYLQCRIDCLESELDQYRRTEDV